jgi:alpha-tubulin suppressor-like RCC1 family protein
VSGITNAEAISASGPAAATHACALLHSGRIECWGYNGSGQLGDGTTTDALTPVFVENISNAASITTSASGSCAVLADGSADCWGDTPGASIFAPPAAIPGITSATQIVTSSAYQGAHTCVMLTSGQIECEGDNERGELGNGTTTPSSTPVPVNGIASATAIASGARHTCALVSGGAVYCWGANYAGQLGDGTTTNRTTPVLVAGLPAAHAIAAGEDTTCAILLDGTIRCWGDDTFGELGYNAFPSSYSASPVAISGITDATGLSVGNQQMCARDVTGTVKCWEVATYWNDRSGATNGDGVGGLLNLSSITDATAVAGGDGQACALTTGGSIQCWGEDNHGELGNGTLDYDASPQEVQGLP